MKAWKLISVGVLMFALSGCWEYADGEKIGTIIKLEKSGFFCKTWEATMIRGGFTDGTGVAGTTVSRFTIEYEALVPIVKQFMEQQTPVRATFHEEVNSFCRSDSQSVFLTKIEARAEHEGGKP